MEQQQKQQHQHMQAIMHQMMHDQNFHNQVQAEMARFSPTVQAPPFGPRPPCYDGNFSPTQWMHQMQPPGQMQQMAPHQQQMQQHAQQQQQLVLQQQQQQQLHHQAQPVMHQGPMM
jgi:hypothetical protein